MSDELDIEAIEARLNAATPGAWEIEREEDDFEESPTDLPAIRSIGPWAFIQHGATSEINGAEQIEADAALIAHAPEDLRALLAEVRRLADANQRLTDLVRYARGPLHEDGLLTDAEYADLAGLTGSPARLEGYDAIRGELERTKRALNVATGERDEARAALQSARRSHRADLLTIGAVVGLPEGEADIGYICDRIQRTQAEVRAARVAGARVMQVEAVRVCTMVADHSVGLHTEPGPAGARMASREIRALDPAAVVGSGPTTCPTCKGEAKHSHAVLGDPPCETCGYAGVVGSGS